MSCRIVVTASPSQTILAIFFALRRRNQESMPMLTRSRAR